MTTINRGPFNALVDDDGTNTVGSPWNKTAIKDVLLDPIDVALAAAGGATLPISLTTDVTGTLQAAQEPAHTGDVTNASGSLALAIGAGKVTNSMLAGGIDLATKVTGILPAAAEPAHTGDVTNTAGSLALVIGAAKVLASMLAGSIPWSKLVGTDAAILPKQISTGTTTLTDGASVAITVTERYLYYRLVAAGDRTIAAPTGTSIPDGLKIIIQHLASAAARTLALTTGAGGFRFGSDITALTQTASGKTDYIGAIYNATDNRWDVVAVTKGF